MIGELLKECTDAAGVARLFGELGYPVEVRTVGHEALAELGLTAANVPVHHITRFGGIDLYVARSRTDEQSAFIRELERVLAERNQVIKPVFVELQDANRLSIHARTGRARRRLDIDTAAPSPDSIDRISELAIPGDGPGTDDPAPLFDRVLDREALGRRFFEQFRRATRRVSQALHEACPAEPLAVCQDQALLLLSRVLFAYLLQRKGWLNDDYRYLRERLSGCVRRRRNFQSTILEPLFFDCLNTPRTGRKQAARRLGRIPYLNGGLFEPSAFERRNVAIELTNELWVDVLDSTFEAFSLCVSEGDEEGAHVDPEMLGKVFEKLMGSEERARTGSFYTPRAVVDRLTQSGIVQWCAEGDERLAETLSAMLRSEAAKLEAPRARDLLRRLEGISVLDPACGSGAFLLSALRTIESLTTSLLATIGAKPPDNLRARIAASSLFGVDLKMEAVRLCELRIWLAIVSGSMFDADSVPPLPNLDRNIMQGNSLLGPLDFLAEGRGDVYREWVRGLRAREELLNEYRHSSSKQRRKLAGRLRESDVTLARALLERSLERDVSELQTLSANERGLFDGAPSLAKSSRAALEARVESTHQLLDRLDDGELSFFSFDLHFAHVLARGGFSVVAGNPPWVRGSRIEPAARRVLADRFESFSSNGRTGFCQAELAMAFIERSISLTASGGTIAQLVPSKIMSADYARAVRKVFVREVAISEVVDWSTEGRTLFGADVFPLGIVASKSKPARGIEFSSGGECFTIERDELSIAGPGSTWSALPPDVRNLVGRIRDRCAPLEQVLERRPVMGVKTGANRTFFLPEIDIANGRVFVPSLDLELPTGAVVRTVRGRDLRKWRAVDSTWMLWPAALEGDLKLRRRVATALGVETRTLRLDYVRSEHLGLKVAWKDVSRGLIAALMPDQVLVEGASFAVVPNQTLYSIDVASRAEGLALGGLLNSTVVNALALETAERAKDHHWRYLAQVVGALPWPRLESSGESWRALVKLARSAEAGGDNDRELDLLVARIYGLSRDELRVLETFVRRRLGRCDEND